MNGNNAGGVAVADRRPSGGLVQRMAEEYGLEPAKFLGTLKETYFRPGTGEQPLTNEELAAGLVVCHKYGLDPFTREIHCTRAKGRLLVMVGVDGWLKIAQRTGQLDGMEFEERFDEEGRPEAVTATVYRKDQAHPTKVTAYYSEYRRDTEPWRAMPLRMLRHKAIKEALRYAFAISGIDDEDDPAEAIATIPHVRSSRSLSLGSPKTEEAPAAVPELEVREPGSDG